MGSPLNTSLPAVECMLRGQQPQSLPQGKRLTWASHVFSKGLSNPVYCKAAHVILCCAGGDVSRSGASRQRHV